MTTRNSNGDKNSFAQVMTWVTNICFPFVMAGGGWVTSEVIQHKADIAAIKSNRYTSADAVSDQRLIQSELAAIRGLVFAIDKKVPDKIPPEWFESEVHDLQEQMKQIQQEIRSIR